MPSTRLTTLAALTVVGVGAALVTGPAAPAAAATPPVAGTVSYATEDTWAHRLTVEGLIFDRRDERRSLTVDVFADGHRVGRTVANIASPVWAREHHVAGRHAFRTTVPVRGTVARVVVLPVGRSTDGLVRGVRHTQPPAGTRIIDVAKRYLHARYVDGGASPRGFDCSGYTQWVYRYANVARLPHNAESQRHVRGMHRITRSAARPGDLIFYFAGGPAFHVAIYAGNDMQYAAATPRDGVRYQRIWSRNIEFRTVTH